MAVGVAVNLCTLGSKACPFDGGRGTAAGRMGGAFSSHSSCISRSSGASPFSSRMPRLSGRLRVCHDGRSQIGQAHAP